MARHIRPAVAHRPGGAGRSRGYGVPRTPRNGSSPRARAAYHARHGARDLRDDGRIHHQSSRHEPARAAGGHAADLRGGELCRAAAPPHHRRAARARCHARRGARHRARRSGAARRRRRRRRGAAGSRDRSCAGRTRRADHQRSVFRGRGAGGHRALEHVAAGRRCRAGYRARRRAAAGAGSGQERSAARTQARGARAACAARGGPPGAPQRIAHPRRRRDHSRLAAQPAGRVRGALHAAAGRRGAHAGRAALRCRRGGARCGAVQPGGAPGLRRRGRIAQPYRCRHRGARHGAHRDDRRRYHGGELPRVATHLADPDACAPTST